MSNGESSAQDRREYFRVDDDVRISYTKLDQRSGEQLARTIKAGLPTSFQLRAKIETTDHDLQAARTQMVDLPQAVQHYLTLLEQKISQLSQVTELLTGNAQTVSVCEVSLSGGGVAVPTAEALAIGQMVELCMQLAGETTAIHALAEVTDCRRDPQGFNVAMEFRSISEDDQEAIIRRTVQRQGQQIRALADDR